MIDTTERGTVKSWNLDRGFGFVRGDDGTEAFVHVSALADGATELQAGQRITYRTYREARGPRAVEVRKVYAQPAEQGQLGTAPMGTLPSGAATIA